MKPFGEQRDAILAKYAVRFDEKGNSLAVDEEAEPAEDVVEWDAAERIAQADKEMDELLQVEYEALPADQGLDAGGCDVTGRPSCPWTMGYLAGFSLCLSMTWTALRRRRSVIGGGAVCCVQHHL